MKRSHELVTCREPGPSPSPRQIHHEPLAIGLTIALSTSLCPARRRAAPTTTCLVPWPYLSLALPVSDYDEHSDPAQVSSLSAGG